MVDIIIFHQIDPAFRLQLLKCTFFVPPYLLSCQAPCITNFLRSPWAHDQTAAVPYLKRLVRHPDFFSVEFQIFPEQVVGTFEIRTR